MVVKNFSPILKKINKQVWILLNTELGDCLVTGDVLTFNFSFTTVSSKTCFYFNRR